MGGVALLLAFLPTALLAQGGTPGNPIVVAPTDAKAPVIRITEQSNVRWRTGGFQDDTDSEIESQGGVMGLVALSGGRYLLSESSRVRVFGPDGREVWRVGRNGAGPQEFSALGWPCGVRGDTVVVTDQRNARFSVIVVGKGVIGTIPTERRHRPGSGCSTDGNILVAETVRRPGAAPTDASPYRVSLIGADGVKRRDIVDAAGIARTRVGAGQLTAGRVGPHVYVADPNVSTITMYDTTGRFLRQLAINLPRVRVTDGNIPDRFGAAPAGGSGADLDAWWDRIRAAPRETHWPAFLAVTGDAEGRFWIQIDEERGATETLWWVVSADGRVIADVRLPRPTRDRRVHLLNHVPGGLAFYYEDTEGAPWVAVVGYPATLR